MNKGGRERDRTKLADFLRLRGFPALVKPAESPSDHFEARDVKTFRRHYPDGANWVVCQDIREVFLKSRGKVLFS